VLDDGVRRVALVSLDLIGIDHDDVQVCRAAVARVISVDYVLIAATHTHNAPDIIGAWAPLPFPYERPYVAQVAQAVATAVAEAANRAVPATIRVAAGDSGNPPLVHDTRPPRLLDDRLTVWQARAKSDGHTIATVVHLASHCITIPAVNFDISSDFPDSMRRALEEGFETSRASLRGYGGVALFFNGALGGRLTPAGVRVDLAPPGTPVAFRRAAGYGRQVALRAAYLLETNGHDLAEPLSISVAARTCTLPLDNALLAILLGLQVLKRPAVAGGVRTEVAIVRVGPLAFFAVPGMMFPELAREVSNLREDSDESAKEVPVVFGADEPNAPLEGPLETLAGDALFIPIGLANDLVGNIIPRRQWDTRPPFIGGGWLPPYGEIVSPGVRTAAVLLEAFQSLETKTER